MVLEVEDWALRTLEKEVGSGVEDADVEDPCCVMVRVCGEPVTVRTDIMREGEGVGVDEVEEVSMVDEDVVDVDVVDVDVIDVDVVDVDVDVSVDDVVVSEVCEVVVDVVVEDDESEDVDDWTADETSEDELEDVVEVDEDEPPPWVIVPEGLDRRM